MTSEKLSKDNTRNPLALQIDMAKHRLWLIALSGLAFFMFYVLIPLIALVHSRNILILQENAFIRTELLNEALSLYGLDSEWLSLAVAALAVLFAMAGFSYLYRMNALDFYESEPFTRWERFLHICVNNLVIFTPLLIASTVIAMLFTLIFGGLRLIVYLEIAIEMVRLFVLFFAVSGMATLAAVLSGNLVIAVMLMGFLTFVELFIRLLFTACGETYFTTVNSTLGLFGGFGGLTSPLVMDIAHLSGKSYAYTYYPTSRQLGVYTTGVAPYLLAMALVGIVGFVAAYYAYKNRKLENTGRGLCYPFAESVVKIIIAVIVGVFAGILIDSMVDTVHKNFSLIFFFIVILAVVLTCTIGEVIFAKNIRMALKRAWQMPVCIVVSIVILYGFKLDVFGYDSYVPDPSQVESAAFSYGQIYYDTVTNETYYYDETGDFSFDIGSSLTRMHLTGASLDALCEVAKIAMPAQRNFVIAISGYNEYMDTAEYNLYDVSVVYRLKNGKEVTRHMAVPQDIDEGLMNTIIGSDEFKAGRYDLDGFAAHIENPRYMQKSTATAYYEYGGMQDQTSLDEEQALRLAEAYRKDLVNYDFTFAKEHKAIGTLNLEITTRWDRGSDYYSDAMAIYPSYKNTIKYLKKLKIYHDASYKADEVDHFQLYLSDQTGYDWETYYYEDGNIIEYVKDDQIKALCKVFCSDTYTGDWYPNEDEDRIYLSAVLSDGNDSYVYGYIPRDKAPAFLKKDVAKMEEE